MIRILLQASAFIAAVFLLSPIVMMVIVSFSPSANFAMPTDGLSLAWYRQMWTWDSFWESFRLSVGIAALAAVVSLAIGIPLALAVTYGRFPGRQAILGFVLSPLMLPGIVIGIAALTWFRRIVGFGTVAEIALVHVIIAMPYVIRVFAASLGLFDRTLLDAARTLGMAPARAVVEVMVPAMVPAALASGIFAFLASFDNYSIALFLGNVYVKTLPVRMIEYFDQSPDPTLAAISTFLLLISLLAVWLLHRLIGIDALGARH